MSDIKIGDTVVYRPDFGMGQKQSKVVVRMERSEEPRQKYGESVTSVTRDEVADNMVTFGFGNSWCYSDQICLEDID